MPDPPLPSNLSRLLCGLGTFKWLPSSLVVSPANLLAFCPYIPPQGTSASSNKSGMQFQGLSIFPQPQNALKTSINITSEKSFSSAMKTTSSLD